VPLTKDHEAGRKGLAWAGLEAAVAGRTAALGAFDRPEAIPHLIWALVANDSQLVAELALRPLPSGALAAPTKVGLNLRNNAPPRTCAVACALWRPRRFSPMSATTLISAPVSR
jgi:hypothetical protein